jgi:hypothetical protein
MTGSITGLVQTGLVGGFTPNIITGIGSPMDVVLAPSGTLMRDFTNDYTYMNCTADGLGAGSTWVLLTSGA